MQADVKQICGKIPDWLASADASSMENDFFPLTQILSGSVYYPACGFDGGPIANLGHQYQSYVYVDYGCSRADLHENLAKHPFSGYQMVGRREVRIEELTPAGWGLPYLTPREVEQYQARTRDERIGTTSFCDWLIFDREPSKPSCHGPRRFSLLYLSADGVAAFHALYVCNGLCPSVIALIQPGYGFGGNWTDFYDPKGPMARTLMTNSAGTPKTLLYGGWGARKYFGTSPWPYYKAFNGWYSYASNGNVGVWTV